MSHDSQRVDAQFPVSGKAKLAFVGEAPGQTETFTGVPLTGPSGKLFDQALRAVGIDRRECLVTNALNFVLRNNDIKTIAEKRQPGAAGPFAPWQDASVAPGAYLSEEVVNAQLGRLRAEIGHVGAEVVVPMGGLAAWALLAVQGHGAIKKIRGAPQPSKLVPAPCLPTFHPAFILRSYHLYPILLSDFTKALRLVNGTLPAAKFTAHDVKQPDDFDRLIVGLTSPVAVDIETVKHQFIDCIGFGDATSGFCVTMFDNKTFKPTWTQADEAELRRRVCRWLESPAPKVFQNGAYDVQMLWERWHVQVRGWTHDTRLLHKALFAELPADLASMASLHTTLPVWKPLKSKEDKRNA